MTRSPLRALVAAATPLIYGRVAAGHPAIAIACCAPDLVTSSPGLNAFGGERRSRAAYRAWLRRLHRLSPCARLNTERVEVLGTAGDLRIFTRWRCTVTTTDGRTFTGHGSQRVRLYRGRVVSVRDDWDLAVVEELCAHLAELGIAEALTDPITV